MTSTTHAQPFTMDDKPAVLITCTCASHPEGKTAALVVGRASFPEDKIHGYVLMAHHPANIIRDSAARKGVFPA